MLLAQRTVCSESIPAGVRDKVKAVADNKSVCRFPYARRILRQNLRTGDNSTPSVDSERHHTIWHHSILHRDQLS